MENENKFDVTQVNSTKSYVFFLFGQLISLLGTSILIFTLVLWITFTSKSDPTLANYTGLILGLASFLGFGPMVLTFIFAGVLVDRWNRTKIILWTNLIEAFLSVFLMVLFLTNDASIAIVLVVLALKGIAQGFLNPTIQAIVPLLVPRKKLTKINSFENLGISSVNLLGPVLGALIISIFGLSQMDLVLFFDAISFLVVLIPIAFIKIPHIRNDGKIEKKTSFKVEFIEGLSFIRNTKGLLALLTTFTMINFLITPVQMLLPLVIFGSFTKDITLVSIILALASIFLQIGSIGTYIVLTRYKFFNKNVFGVVSGQSLTYLSLFVLIISLFFGNQNLLYFAELLNGCSIVLANVHSQTIWQSVVPPELQGRVMSIRMTIAWVMIPVSMLISGFLSDIIGYFQLFVFCFIFGSLYLLFAWFFTGLPRVEDDLGLVDKDFSISKPLPEEPVVSE